MSDHATTKSPEDVKTATGLLGGTLLMLKKMFDVDFTSFLAVLAPKLRREAEALADKLKKDLPVDHLLRSDGAEMLLDLIATQIKKVAEGQPKGVQTVILEFAKFLEAFSQEFCNEKDSTGAAETTKTKVAKIIMTLSEVDKAFDEDGRRRLKAAKSLAEKQTVGRQLLAEAKIRAQLKLLMTEGLPEKKVRAKPGATAPAPAAKTTIVKKVWKFAKDKWTTEVQPWWGSLDAKHADRKLKYAPIADKVGKVAANPMGMMWRALLGR
ncbi:MAG: hypothetical protein AAB511_03795 [Patescibacteria group bacterium]